MDERQRRGAGGTSGGLGEFLLGLGMVIVGAYLLSNRLTVSSGYWTLWGYSAFGISLIPLMIGIGLLFFNGRSLVGWLLLGGSLLAIGAGIITNLHLYFQPTSLFATLVMLTLLAGGVGLVAKALRPH